MLGDHLWKGLVERAVELMMFHYYQESFRHKSRLQISMNESLKGDCSFVRLEWDEITMLMSSITYEFK